MNVWLAAAIALLGAMAPLGWIVWHEAPIDGVAALQLASTLAVSILLLLCVGVARPEFSDLALALASLSFAGTLLFARLLERWV